MGECSLRRSCAEALAAAMQSPAPARGPAGTTTGREASGGGDGGGGGRNLSHGKAAGEGAQGAMGGITMLMEFSTRHDVDGRRDGDLGRDAYPVSPRLSCSPGESKAPVDLPYRARAWPTKISSGYDAMITRR